MSSAVVVGLFLHYKYPILVLLAFIEGPYVMMMSGFLIKLGILSLIPTYIALSVGDLLGDIAWYYVGYFFGIPFINRFGMYIGITKGHLDTLISIFVKHKKKILMGSKLTAGFGLSLSTLITAGIARIPIGEFILLNLVGQFAWTAIMLAIGYFFGNLYIAINNIGGKIFIVFLALLVLFLMLRASKYVGQRIRTTLE